MSSLGIASLPTEILQRIIDRSLRPDDPQSDAAALLLVCKRWSGMVQPDRCDICYPSRNRAALSKALSSRHMRDVQVWEGNLPATAFANWTALENLEIGGMDDAACMHSLPHSCPSLRALRLVCVTFAAQSERALLAALSTATALEKLVIDQCTFDGRRSLGTRLLEPLSRCAALRCIDLDCCPLLPYACLPQLTAFHWHLTEEETFGAAAEGGLAAGLATLSIEAQLSSPAGYDDAALVRVLTGNSTVQTLRIRSCDDSDDLWRAVESMTGVTRLTSWWDGHLWDAPMFASWTSRLTDLQLDMGPIPPRRVMESLAEFTRLTALVFTVTDPDAIQGIRARERKTRRQREALACIGKCSSLRSLTLRGSAMFVQLVTDGEGDGFLLVLCVDVLAALQGLTQLVISQGENEDGVHINPRDCQRMQRVASCDITWGEDPPSSEWNAEFEEYRVRARAPRA